MTSSIQVSQVFLTLKEGTTINDFPVYIRSRDMFKKLTSSYTLFDDDMADDLMRNYPEFYDMWKNVKYAIMKVDILRFVILYHYGGFVSDLDQIPNIDDIETIIGDGTKFIVYRPTRVFNYEVIYSPKNNELCLEFIRYIKTQIEEKDKIKVYETWKGRYVLQTTGPRSFKRFLDKYHKHNRMIDYIEVGCILDKEDIELLRRDMHKFPFIGLQTGAWTSSIGLKDTYKHRTPIRDELMKIFDDIHTPDATSFAL